MTRAVFFDVDFTLIYPGPTFQGKGYQAFCAQFGMTADAAKFADAVAAAAPLLHGPDDPVHDNEVFVTYTQRIIEGMGANGPRLEECARAIHAAWATNHHFELYADVPAALAVLTRAGIRVGLISNSHRCLESFQAHFELTDHVAAAVSSAQHGFMKPHPSIFKAAMRLVDVDPANAVMVGDSVRQDVEGALRTGMRAIFLHRGAQPHAQVPDLAAIGVPTIHSLDELPQALALVA